MPRLRVIAFACCTAAAVVAVTLRHPHATAAAQPAATATAGAAADGQAQIAQLQAQVKHLETLLPDQAAVMTKVGYHFTNLYAAIDHENWPLADFYLSETQNNIDWAVRVKPVRQDAAGRDVDLGGIADSVKNTQLKALKDAIAAKDRSRAVALYDQTLTACYACHKASAKPYLRPQRPAGPEVNLINFDPNATTPE
jgi:hypothetical protein